MATINHNGSARDTYFDLIRHFPLTPIRDEDHLNDAIRVIDSLTDRPIDSCEEDYLEVLLTLVEAYEDGFEEFGHSSAVEILRHLMDSNNHTQSDLVKMTGLSKSLISEIFNQSRDISLSTARKFAKVYSVPTSMFVE